jgi:hypothetical protein
MKENSIDDNFEEVWGRIISTTEIKSLRHLAKIIGKTQPTISAAKAKRKFSVEWAYLVGVMVKSGV